MYSFIVIVYFFSHYEIPLLNKVKLWKIQKIILLRRTNISIKVW